METKISGSQCVLTIPVATRLLGNIPEVSVELERAGKREKTKISLYLVYRERSKERKDVRFLKKTCIIVPTKLFSLPVQCSECHFLTVIFPHTLQSIIVEKLCKQTSS